MSNDRSIKSFTQLGELISPSNNAPKENTGETALLLYEAAKVFFASGNFEEGIRHLEQIKKLPNLPAEFRRLVQERVTAVENIGKDEEANKLRVLIRDRIGEHDKLSILDSFRLRNRLDRPQREIRLSGIQDLSAIGVYRWQADRQGQQLWSRLIREAKRGDRTTLTWFGIALTEHWKSEERFRSWKQAIDIVVSVPANETRKAERGGVDIAGSIAQSFARMAGFPYHPEILSRSAGERAFHVHNESVLRSQYSIRLGKGAILRGRSVLLVDDVVTTGRTVKICADLLLDAGAAEVYVLAISQAESTLTEIRHLGERHHGDVNDLSPWLCLAATPDLGPIRVRALLNHLKEPGAILSASKDKLTEVKGIGPKLADAVTLQGAKKGEYYEKAASLLSAADRIVGARIFTLADSAYPKNLLSSNHAVPVLFGAGLSNDGLDSSRTVAIVGSRHPIQQIKDLTLKIAERLSRAGWIVVSGLAEGCDTCAHEGALAGNSPTWAFLGCGVDQIYPPSNKKLRDTILEKGWLFSEYQFGTRINQDFLRKRNNLIVGASSAVIIMQTARDGGTMNSARSAEMQERPILCMTPLVEGEQFSGNEMLLRDRKAVALQPQDVLEQLTQITAKN